MKNETAVNYDAIRNDETTTNTVNDASMLTCCRLQLKGHSEPSRRIANRLDLERYCKELLMDEAMESFRLICIDAQCRVICESEISTGTLSSCDAYPRKIAAVAILSNAHSVFFAHNHPGGTCSPSAEDIRATETLQKMLKTFEIRVLDHMIVTPEGRTYSMAQHGDLYQ